jgi:hypothetical protein
VNEQAETLLARIIHCSERSRGEPSRARQWVPSPTSPARQTSNPPTLLKRFSTGAWIEERKGVEQPCIADWRKSPIPVHQLILRRLCSGLVETFLSIALPRQLRAVRVDLVVSNARACLADRRLIFGRAKIRSSIEGLSAPPSS